MNPKDTYQENLSEAQKQLSVLSRHSSIVGLLRFVAIGVVILSIYYYLYSFDSKLLGLCLLGVISFLYLVSKHADLRLKTSRYKNQKKHSEQELQFLHDGYYPFDGGEEHLSKDDLYETDLDILGDHSLYQYLNRTKSYLGGKTLAAWLQQEVPTTVISERAQSNKELRDKTSFRKDFWVSVDLADLDRDNTEELLQWDSKPLIPLSKLAQVLIYLIPILYISIVIIQLIWHPFPSLLTVIKYGSGASILLLLMHQKHLRSALLFNDKMGFRLRAFAELWKRIEKENFNTPSLKKLQTSSSDTRVSNSLLQLSSIFNNLESVQNLLGALIINSFLPFHLYYYQELIKWRRKNPHFISKLPERVGLWETYLSLSQYAYNELHNHYPSYDTHVPIAVNQARHPLMKSSESVANSLDFSQYRFFILTGSNMSGKSTFLRTLGSILVLGKLGTSVPALSANLHNRPMYASMRVSDSLADQSSYFHAELTKLKRIMDESEESPAFVLLDEILRGTNSDDKRTGTMDVIEKLLKKGSMGIIATHDLEVCNLADIHPLEISNICFESEIIEDEISFDYKLKNGICKNRNATFLMKKMNII